MLKRKRGTKGNERNALKNSNYDINKFNEHFHWNQTNGIPNYIGLIKLSIWWNIISHFQIILIILQGMEIIHYWSAISKSSLFLYPPKFKFKLSSWKHTNRNKNNKINFPLIFYSKFLRNRNHPSPRVFTFAYDRLPRFKTRKLTNQPRWSPENHRFWIRQEIKGPDVDTVRHTRVLGPRNHPIQRTQSSCRLVGVG